MKTTQSSRGNLSCVIPGGFLTGKGGTGTCGLANLYLYVAETLESCGSLECKVERGSGAGGRYKWREMDETRKCNYSYITWIYLLGVKT